MNEPIIAIICDFDDTLGVDSISFFLQEQGINPQKFWDEVKKRVRESFDPPLAYMNLLLSLGKAGKVDLSKYRLRKLGQKLPLFEGLPKALPELFEFIEKGKTLSRARVSLELYIVSGGLEEMIRGSRIAVSAQGIFACNFAYNPKGIPVLVRSAVSFTEKTRFVFGINKGLTEKEILTEPYRINDAIELKERRIPFSQMIYIGDGPSDIPCLSLITSNGGAGIGVSAPAHTFRKGYELARGKRLTVGPYTANYEKGSDLRKALEETIFRIGLEIGENQRRHVVSAPTHS